MKITSIVSAAIALTLCSTVDGQRLRNPRTPLAPPPATYRSPHAVFINDDPYHYGTIAAIGGLRKQIKWTELQPNNGDVTKINWAYYDGLVAGANNTYHKQIEFSLLLLTDPPTWLKKTKGVHTYTFKNGTNTLTIVLPWEAPVQTALVNLITAICDRYDGQLDGIVMGGIGFATESYFPTPTSLTPPLAMTLEDEIALWTDSSNFLIDVYAAHLQSTAFILAVGIPFTGTGGSFDDGSNAITAVVNHGLLYDNFGVMNWGLNANADLGFLPWDFVYNYSPTNAAGFQVAGSTTGNGGHLNGTLAEVLAAGIALRMQWVEVYAVDGKNPIYFPLFLSTASQLYPPPP